MTSKAVMITQTGGFEVLKVVDIPIPDLKPGQVRIRVRAAGLNFADLMAREGLYPDAPPLPAVMGYEGSGVVEEISPSSDDTPVNYSVGSRVFFFSRFGAQADTVVVPAKLVYPLPDNMSFEEGAALPVIYLTAYQAVVINGNLRKGESILIHAAAGGVGTAAVQIARSIPDVTIFGTSSASKHDFLRSIGVKHCIDYRTQQFDTEVMRLTDGKGVNVVLDSQGGDALKRGYDILRPPGRIVAFGFANMVTGAGSRSLLRVMSTLWQAPKFSPIDLMNQNRSVSGINMLRYFDDPESLMSSVNSLLEMYEQGKIKPVIDKSFKFSEAAEAHKFLNDRKNVGKVLLIPDTPIDVNTTPN
eukprot:TRINITY_DN9192_c0_g1_i1.p1 TRINITY_DN9192_c0_g1~~TRINITY_DN9192_c0_g1_i1.p1  ORF type:complete len:358 (+),score=86.01 TRINITY_DN9192_c0_g1_i1:88-1161(+)